MSTKIKQDGDYVVLNFLNPLTGEEETKMYYARGGSVYQEMANGNDNQVCDRLAHTGNTLRVSRGSLIGTIRSEYKLLRYDLLAIRKRA